MTPLSLCSAHIDRVEGCAACHAEIRDLIPDFDELIATATASGFEVCAGCGFVYYRTVQTCPLCMQASSEVDAQ